MIERLPAHPKLTRIPGLLLASLFGAGPVGAAAPSFDDESVRADGAVASCACASGQGAGTGGLGLLWALALRRRRAR